MKARDLKQILKAMGWWDTGKGGKHEKWTNGVRCVAVPRHKEIPEGTALAVLEEARKHSKESES